MATTKPTKPTNLMPRHFADDGIKNNFSSTKITSGFSSNFDDILQGDNLNYMIDSIGKELQYLSTVVDFIVNMPINKTIKVNSNNNLEYVNLVEDVSDKANVDLDNLSEIGEARFSQMDAEIDNVVEEVDLKLASSNMTPDWANAVSKSINTTYTAESNGYFGASGYAAGGNPTMVIYVNGVERMRVSFHGGGGSSYGIPLICPISKGDTYKVSWANSAYFVPVKGGN